MPALEVDWLLDVADCDVVTIELLMEYPVEHDVPDIDLDDYDIAEGIFDDGDARLN